MITFTFFDVCIVSHDMGLVKLTDVINMLH